MQKTKVNILLGSVMAFVMIAMSSCLKSSDPTPQPAQAYMSILHLATAGSAPSVEIYFNNEKRSNAFQAGAVSQVYSAVDKGGYSVNFKKAGSDSLVASVPASLYDSLGFYTLVLYNEPGGNVQAMRIEDDFSDLTLDKPYFRFFQVSPSIAGLGPVDLYMDNTKIFQQRTLADNEFSDYYNQFSATTVGTHNFQVKLSSNDSLITSLSDISLQAGNAYTIYLKGNIGGTTEANKIGLGALRAAN